MKLNITRTELYIIQTALVAHAFKSGGEGTERVRKLRVKLHEFLSEEHSTNLVLTPEDSKDKSEQFQHDSSEREKDSFSGNA